MRDRNGNAVRKSVRKTHNAIVDQMPISTEDVTLRRGWYSPRMSTEIEALNFGIARLRKNSAQRAKLANWLLAAGMVFLVSLVTLMWFEHKIEARFTKEFVAEMTASPKTLPDALWLTHEMSVMRAKLAWEFMLLAMCIGGFIGAGISFRRKGPNDILLNLVDRVAVLERHLKDGKESS